VAAVVATRVDGRSASINTGDLKMWLELVDAYLGTSTETNPIGWVTPDAHNMLGMSSLTAIKPVISKAWTSDNTVPVYGLPPAIGGCAMGVGDGGGNLFVYGSHEAIKRAQELVLAASVARETTPPAATGRPTKQQVDGAYAVFLHINGGDTDKAKTDLGTWPSATARRWRCRHERAGGDCKMPSARSGASPQSHMAQPALLRAVSHPPVRARARIPWPTVATGTEWAADYLDDRLLRR
jgi:hypothetical protein